MDLDKLKDYRALRNAILRLLPYLDSGITELIMNKEKEIWLYKLNGTREKVFDENLDKAFILGFGEQLASFRDLFFNANYPTLNTSIPTSRYRVSMNHFAISADNELSLNIRVPSDKKFDLKAFKLSSICQYDYEYLQKLMIEGKRVIEVFENAYQFIIDLTYTKQMEEVLDEIVESKSSYLDFLQNLATKCPKIEKLERNDDEIKPSSEGQITYIENILRDLQLDLSEEFKNYKEDNRIAKAFLDRYIKEHEFFEKNNKKASSSNNNEIRPATPKQINFAEMLAKKHNVKLPKGFKYSMKVCGDFINEYHKK